MWDLVGTVVVLSVSAEDGSLQYVVALLFLILGIAVSQYPKDVVVDIVRVGRKDEQMCGVGMRSSVGSWRYGRPRTSERSCTHTLKHPHRSLSHNCPLSLSVTFLCSTK